MHVCVVSRSKMPVDDAAIAAAAIRSANGYRSWIRRHIASLAAQTDVIQQAPSSNAKEMIEATISTIQKTVDNASARYLTYSEHEHDQGKVADAEKRATEMMLEAQDAISAALVAISKVNDVLDRRNRPPAAAVLSPPVPPAGAGNALRPDKLPGGSTPMAVQKWKREFTTFFTHSGYASWAPVDQHTVFASCLEDSMFDRVMRHPLYREDRPVLPEAGHNRDSLLEIVDAISLSDTPIYSRRLEWFAMRQRIDQGETVEEFLGLLRQKAVFADIAALTYDDIMVFRALSGVEDKGMLTEWRRFPNATFAELEREADRYGQAKREEKALDRSKAKLGAKAASVTASSGFPSPTKPDRSAKPQQGIPDALKGLCLRCGSKSHKTRGCKVDKEKLKCDYCSKRNHMTLVCLTKARAEAAGSIPKAAVASASPPDGTPGDPPAYVSRIVAKALSATTSTFPTPCLQLTVRPTSARDVDKSFIVPATPDSGATMSVFSASLIQEWGIETSHCFLRLECAKTGETLDSSRQITVQCHADGGPTVEITAIVSSDLASGEILISWHDLVRLGVLHDSFPAVLNMHGVSTEWLPRREAACSLKPLDMTLPLAEAFPDVLSDNLDATMRVKGPPLSIAWKKGIRVKPKKCLVPKQVPVHMEKEAKALVSDLVAKGVLVELDDSVSTEWLSRGHFVPKPGGGKVRLVTDYVHLNSYVDRPVHPFPSPDLIFKMIPKGSTWFAKLDAVHGYFQLPMDYDSQLATAFLLPWGRYMYTVAPMGMASSGDWWCKRSDEALVGLEGVVKLVDDILVMADTKEELLVRIRHVLERCRLHGIVLSKKKFVIGQEVPFAGHVVNGTGVRPAEDKVEAIRAFPTPTDPPSLRSFMGMAIQLMAFVPDLSHAMVHMRKLLQKGATWLWSPDMNKEFLDVKRILTSDLLVHHYDPTKPATLITDACAEGLGFILVQHNDDGHTDLITCGSRAVSDTEKRYAPVELECLAAQWAVDKCDFYLRGNPHTTTLVTDHRPLVGTFDKPLSAISNPRLQRMREKMVGVDLDVVWQPGKRNRIADALSRCPLFPAPPDNGTVEIVRSTHSGVNMGFILQCAREDPDYQLIVSAKERGVAHPKSLPLRHPARLYRSVWQDLSVVDLEGTLLLVYDGHRVVVPPAARPRVLDLLHLPHQGHVKTKRAAQQLYYWPGMNAAITDRVDSCSTCQALLPSKSPTPLTPGTPAAVRPMQNVGMDLFSVGEQTWFVMVDRYSGFPFVCRLSSTTASAITTLCEKWFFDWGIPEVIRSDGGPQFACKDFATWCTKLDIRHEISSAYNPESNGLAEAAVKQAKYLVIKCIRDKQDYTSALHEFRNTPRADGFSPYQLMFGHRSKTALPALNAALADVDTLDGQMRRQKRAEAWAAASRSRRPPTVFHEGDKVLMQDPISKRWTETGTILSKEDSGSYHIVSEHSDRVKRRNEKFLRHLKPSRGSADAADVVPERGAKSSLHDADDSSVLESDRVSLSPPPSPTLPRRSERLASKLPVSYAEIVRCSLPSPTRPQVCN